ncbi:MAG: electron transfer flavoprotein subunit beta/FixA family protein [Candidatus Dadabacteria bacterium]|nr:MAG: electron transfer flavoprotein subunit beta/FixA family protein [Candidatus Dadabacteria bacterium]
MKIMVPVRRVPNPDVKVRLKKDGSGIETEGVNFLVNPFDEYAIEEAVRITEKSGGEVFLVSIGGPENEETLRAGLALGAHRAYLVDLGGECYESSGIADILAAVFRQENPDLVIMGKQSVDTDNNQAAQMLAAKLGLPQACFAYKVELGDGKAVVQREIDGGLEVKEVALPAVITADLRLNQPRYASLPAIMKAKKKEVKKVTPADLGAEPKNRARVLSLSEPPPRKAGQKVASVDELVDKLMNEAKVL